MSIIKKGFTLIEIISCISLVLIVFLSVFSTSNYVLNFSKNIQDDIILEQVATNLEYFIKNNLSKDSVSFDGINKENKEVFFSSIEEEGGFNYILVRKTLSFEKNKEQIRINTKKEVYDKDYKFIGNRKDKNSSNIVEEDIEKMDIDFVDGVLYFDILIRKGDIEKNINFYIKHLKSRKFI